MSGVSITIRVGGDARTELGELIGRIEDRATFFAAASDIMLDQTQTRFREQRAPDGAPWKGLAPATIAKRGGRARPILEVSGVLRGGIHAAPEPSRAVVQTLALPYAAIHQEGGMAGRGRTVAIPARPYLGFGDADERELIELAESMFLP